MLKTAKPTHHRLPRTPMGVEDDDLSLIASTPENIQNTPLKKAEFNQVDSKKSKSRTSPSAEVRPSNSTNTTPSRRKATPINTDQAASEVQKVNNLNFMTPGYPRTPRRYANGQKAVLTPKTEPAIGSILRTPPDTTPVMMDDKIIYHNSQKLNAPTVRLSPENKTSQNHSTLSDISTRTEKKDVEPILMSHGVPTSVQDHKIASNLDFYLSRLPALSSMRKAKPITPPKQVSPIRQFSPIYQANRTPVKEIRQPSPQQYQDVTLRRNPIQTPQYELRSSKEPQYNQRPIESHPVHEEYKRYDQYYSPRYDQYKSPIQNKVYTSPRYMEQPVYSPGYEKYKERMREHEELKSPNTTQSQEDLDNERLLNVKKRADYRVKFGILREAYQHMKIPDFDDVQPIDEIEAMYKQYVKRIHVDSSVEQNKVYLLILWLIIEVVGSRLLKFPFSGYTKYQFKYMKKYQMLLIELGESSYNDSMTSGWPVEARLLAMAIFNGAIFALVQMLANKVGNTKMADELSEMISNFLTESRGEDVLKKAEKATSDNPPPSDNTQEASPPLGGLGNIIAQFASAFTGGGLNGLTGGGNSQPAQPAAKLRRPTTFASRRKRKQSEA